MGADESRTLVGASDRAETESGIPVERLYAPEPRDGPYAAALGDPGSFPYTRGTYPVESTRRHWVHRELSGEGSPRRSNAQLKRLLAMGARGLDVIADAVTYALSDPDHPLARYAVGTQGVSLCRLQDFFELYDGVPLDAISLSHSAPPLFVLPALYATARARGVDPARIRGSIIQYPYYGEDNCYACHLPFALRERISADSIAFAARHMPRFHAFVEDTYFISDGVLGAVDEIALGFIEIRGLVRRLLAQGIDVDSFAPRIAYLLNAGMDFFEVVAKIRATRRLYARMMRDEFGARDPRSWAINITAHSSGFSLTAREPINNVVRGAVQALALAFAGVRAMEISTFDEAYRIPSEEAHRVGLRTQQILDLEVGASRVADPLGGSWYVESLTDELERRIDERIRQIEARGTPEQLAESGFFRSLFAEGMTRYGQRLADGRLPKVGVNCLTAPPEEDTLLRAVAEERIEPDRERVEEIRRFKQSGRDRHRVADALAALRAASDDRDANLMEPVGAAYEAGATLAEVAGVLRESYGWAADPLGSEGRAA